MRENVSITKFELCRRNGHHEFKESYCLLHIQDGASTPGRGLDIIGEGRRERSLQRKGIPGNSLENEYFTSGHPLDSLWVWTSY